MKPSAYLTLIIAMPLLAGCAETQPAVPASPQASARAQIEEAALRSALQQVQAKKSDYKIGSADLIAISVFQQTDLDRKLRVSQNGTISFPLVGTVKVGGLSVTEAEAAISEKLKDYVIAPQVTIFIGEYANKKIFILGEVKQPGSYELPTESKLTLLEAVTLAGGFTQIAAPDRTKVIRNTDGKSQSITVEVSDITRRGQKQKDIPLEPNDVVYVPQSYF